MLSRVGVLVCVWAVCSVLSCCSAGRDDDECAARKTCSACITAPNCQWCSQPNFQRSRCMARHPTSKGSGGCDSEFITNPPSTMIDRIRKELTAGGINGEGAVQISPSMVDMFLRVGEEKTIPIVYQQALDYPVDLYYLMDLSSSMEDAYYGMLSSITNLTSLLRGMSNNYRIGFGSFQDKPELPYLNARNNVVQCSLQKKRECAPPYSFKNIYPLNNDEVAFAAAVATAPISINEDNPEGGLDALMQVLVCDDKIGWRENSRKVIVLVTDAPPHVAGDGKLGGIVHPNDEKCYLDDRGFYTNSLNTDYPSIPQIDNKIKEKQVKLLFLVKKNVEPLYMGIKKHIFDSAVGILSKDFSTIVNFVKTEYKDKVLNSISLSDNATGSVAIRYNTRCESNTPIDRSECHNLTGKPEIEFTVYVKALSCSSDKNKWKQTFMVKPKSLTDGLIINVEIACDCPCEKKGKNSVYCKNHGFLKCGICSCDEGYYGEYCDCGNDAGDDAKMYDDKSCKAPNSTVDCSGLGSCKCGKCVCNPRKNPQEAYSGDFCECNNFSCAQVGGLLCSGADHGRCECGRCMCEQGWSGTACECPKTNEPCTQADSQEVCSGRGTCECGVCQCTSVGSTVYSGPYCEECPGCNVDRCPQLEHCVQCKVYGTGKYDAAECTLNCTHLKIHVVDKLELSDSETTCRAADNTDCIFTFKYKYDENNVDTLVWAQKEKECQIHFNLLLIIVTVVVATVVAGVVMLIVWKVVTSIHDKREFAKFEKERLLAKWDRGDNPLYKPSTSTFRNPTFQKESRL